MGSLDCVINQEDQHSQIYSNVGISLDDAQNITLQSYAVPPV